MANYDKQQKNQRNANRVDGSARYCRTECASHTTERTGRVFGGSSGINTNALYTICSYAILFKAG